MDTHDHAKMAKAIVSRKPYANGGWKIEDVEVRQPEAGEMLVDMVASGVCHTDALIGGLPDGAPMAFYPRVLGHEGSAVVRSIGPGVTIAKPGDAVLLSYTCCQTCEVCKTGYYTHCLSYNDLNFDGLHDVFKVKSDKNAGEDVSGCFFGQSSFASLSIVKETSVVNVQDIIKDRRELEMFAPLGCGVQTGAGSAINVAKATPEDVVLITGTGGVGLSAVMGAKITEAKQIITVDKVQSRLELAKELGATHVINGGEIGDKSLVDAIREMTGGIGPTVIIETTGAPALISAGLAALRNRGRYIQVGTAPPDYKFDINVYDLMVSGKQLIGAVEGHAHPRDFIPEMIQWYRDGNFPVNKLMKLLPAEDFDQALKGMEDGSFIKPILCWT